MNISVIIPSFNTGKYIRSAIDSIIYQYGSEVIVVDGGSTDNTLDILKSYGDRVKWISEKDNGEPDAINKGMRIATGDIIGYLDADDKYELGCFDEIIEQFAYSKYMWMYGKCKVINEDDKETRQLVTRFKEIFQPFYSYQTLLMFDYIAQPTVFWRKEVLQTVGLMNTSERLAFDYDYWLRLGRKYKPLFINEYLASWRSHKKSETAKALAKDMKDGLNLSLKYSPDKIWLRPFQYGIYGLALLGYKAMGAL